MQNKTAAYCASTVLSGELLMESTNIYVPFGNAG